MIFISLHVQEHSGGNFLQPHKNQRDLARFDYAAGDELAAIAMVEEVLVTLRTRFEAEKEAKRLRIEREKAAEELRAEQRRQARTIGRRTPPNEEPWEDEEDETPTGKMTADQAATMQQDARG